jgi:hypothetical protein
MGATLELKYFNSYWLKKLTNVVAETPSAPASPYANVPEAYTPVNATDWFIEESRIRGGYNNTSTDIGVKAHIVEDNANNQDRFNSLIYSGVFNSRTGVNQTNEFSVAEDITRSLDPAHGSIQKLYAEDTNLIIFQEDKVNRALIDKDAIYSAEGSALTTSGRLVIGQIIAYQGKYGIAKDPLSFAAYGYRKYFTDRKRGCVLQLSTNGQIVEISGYGMHDFFRDQLTDLSTSTNGIVGGWDNHTKNYILSIKKNRSTGFVAQSGNAATPQAYNQPSDGVDVTLTLNAANTNITAGMYIYKYTTSGQVVGQLYGRVESVISSGNPSSFKCNIGTQIPGNEVLIFYNESFKTVSFDESVKGWTSLFTFQPKLMFSLTSTFFSTNSGKIYSHYGSSPYANFYGIENDSDVTVVLNAKPSTVKVFKTVNYEGGNDWIVDSVVASSGDIALTPIAKYGNVPNSLSLLESEMFSNKFKRKENKYFANIINNSSPMAGEIVFGNNMTGVKGFFSTFKFKLDNSINQKRELFAVSSDTVESSY